MGLFWDIVKDIPTAANLREKVINLEGQFEALKAENLTLKEKLRGAETQIQQLQAANQKLGEEIAKLTQPGDKLDPTAEEILQIFGLSPNNIFTKNYVLTQVEADSNTKEYWFKYLDEKDYICCPGFNRGEDPKYKLTLTGNKYLMDNPKR